MSKHKDEGRMGGAPRAEEIEAPRMGEIVQTRSSNETMQRASVTEAIRHLSEQRAELLSQVAAMEEFLGFAQHADDLAVRVAKLEKFVGLGG